MNDLHPKFADAFVDAWYVFCDNWKILMFASFVAGLIPVCLTGITFLFMAHLKEVGLIPILIVFLAIKGYTYIGFMNAAFSLGRNEPKLFWHLLFKPKHFLLAAITLFLLNVASAIGLVLLVIPGIFLLCKLFFAPLIAIDRKERPMAAFTLSFQMTKSLFWTIFALYLLCYITSDGPLKWLSTVSGPFFFISMACLYCTVSGYRTPRTNLSKDLFAKSLGSFLLALLVSLVVTTLNLIAVRTFGEARFIPSTGMNPTLAVNDRIFCEKSASYGITKYHRGDIILLYPPPTEMGGKDLSYDLPHVLGRLTGLPFLPCEPAFVKRIIGMPGDTIEIKKGFGVFVNGARLIEPYASEPPNRSMQRLKDIPVYENAQSKDNFVIVPNGQFFVLGDNRNSSSGSCDWGFLNQQRVIARAWLRFSPDFHFF